MGTSVAGDTHVHHQEKRSESLPKLDGSRSTQDTIDCITSALAVELSHYFGSILQAISAKMITEIFNAKVPQFASHEDLKALLERACESIENNKLDKPQ